MPSATSHIPSRITSRNTCRRPRAERQPDAHLARAPRDRERQHAVDADDGEQQRQPAERARSSTRPSARRRATCRSSRTSSGCRAPAGSARAPGSRAGAPAASDPGGTDARTYSVMPVSWFWASGRYATGTASSPSEPYLLSRTMPTISRHGPSRPVDADALADRVARSGKCMRAAAALMTSTERRLLGVPAVEVAAVQQPDADASRRSAARRRWR